MTSFTFRHSVSSASRSAHTDLERKHDAGVVMALREERSELAMELEQELKRIAFSLEESRKNEENHVNAEVGALTRLPPTCISFTP